MMNLLKADLFRLRKSTTFRNSLIIMVGLIIGFSILSFSSEDFFAINITHRNDRKYGFLIGDIKTNVSYLNFFRSSLGFTIFTCLSMLFLITDSIISRYTNGVLKNTISYGHSKYKVYLSNLISNYVGVSIIAMLYISITMVIGICLFKPDVMISKEELLTIFHVTAIVLLILAAMVSFYTLVATVVKSKAIVTTGGALFMTLGSALMFDMISESVQNKIPIYMLLNVCGQPIKSPVLATFATQSVIIILVTTILGCVVFKKQEIK